MENKLAFLKLSREIDNKTLNERGGIKELVIPSRRLIREGGIGIKMYKSSRLSFSRSTWKNYRRSVDEGLTLEKGRIVMCNVILIITYGKKNRVRKVFWLANIEAVVNEEPIEPSNKSQKFDKVFEVELKNRSIKCVEQTNSIESGAKKHTKSLSL